MRAVVRIGGYQRSLSVFRDAMTLRPGVQDGFNGRTLRYATAGMSAICLFCSILPDWQVAAPEESRPASITCPEEILRAHPWSATSAISVGWCAKLSLAKLHIPESVICRRFYRCLWVGNEESAPIPHSSYTCQGVHWEISAEPKEWSDCLDGRVQSSVFRSKRHVGRNTNQANCQPNRGLLGPLCTTGTGRFGYDVRIRGIGQFFVPIESLLRYSTTDLA